MIKKISFSIAGCILIFVFQNCGDVKVGTQQSISAVEPRTEITVCPSNSAEGSTKLYRIVKLFVINLNYVPWKGKLEFDRDSDGLPDNALNVNQASIDPDPNNRRSRWNMLDSVSQYLSEAPGACTGQFSHFGLSDCDILAYRIPSESTFGSDYDVDGIPNYIEVLRNSLPLNFDAGDDPDGDASSIAAEISRGSDPQMADSILSANYMRYSLSAGLGEKCNSIQTKYQLNLDNVSFKEGPGYTDNSPETYGQKVVDYSRTEKENIYLIGYVSEPEVGSGTRETYFKLIKLEKELTRDLIVTENDFIGDFNQ